MQELQQIEHDFEIGRHTGENENKFMSRLKEINEKIINNQNEILRSVRARDYQSSI